MRAILRIFPFLFLFPAPGLAQNIVWSAPVADDSQLRYMKIIGSDENSFYLLRSNVAFSEEGGKRSSKSRRYKLACYSQKMTVRWEKTLAAPVPDAKILEVRIVNGRLLVSAFLATKNRTLQLYLQYLDEKGNYTGAPVQLDELEAARVDEDSRPNLLVSKDESLVGIASRMQKEDEGLKFRIAVCDSALTPLYQKELSPQAGDKLFAAVDIQLSDSGNIFILGKLAAPAKKGKTADEGTYALLSWQRYGDGVLVRDIRAGESVLTDAGLAVDNLNDAAVVSGFYSDKPGSSLAGVFYFSAKSAPAASAEARTAAFSRDFLKKFNSIKMENNKGLVNYSIDRILLRKDGGAVLAAESYSTYSNSYYDYYSQMLISHTYYNYGNILTLSINPDGSLLWGDVLNKEHNSTDDDGYFSSYCSAVYRARMYYIYNKYIDTKTSVMLATVTSTGDQNTLVLFNQLDNIVAVPKAARQIEQDVLLLPAYKENQLCIARIKF
jgi:hypothetical protein